MPPSRSAAAGLVLIAASGCSFYSQSDGERLRDQVYALETQLTNLQRTLRQLESQQERGGKRLAKVASDVSDLNTAARRNDADIGVVLDVVRQDVARMKGQVDGMGERLSQVEAQATKTQEEVDLQFQNLAAKEKMRDAESAKEREAARKAAEKREALLSKPKKALNEAEKLIADGAPAEARQLVRALELSRGKKKGWQVYAPKAQYLIGESYFAEGQFQQAAAAFNDVRKKYPKSKTWAPGAILRLGMCFERLGLNDDAKLFYQNVVSKYPRHPAGKEAKRLLKKLEG